MNMTRNKIYTFVEGRVKDFNSKIYCASKLEPVPQSFPACFICEASHNERASAITLDRDDEQREVTFEVQVCSTKVNGAASECYEIIDIVEAAFKALAFLEISCSVVDNIDPAVTRVVARFTRLICALDPMPVEPQTPNDGN